MIFTMEQRVVIKFCFKLKRSVTETFQTIKTFHGDVCLSRIKVFEWYSRFKNGRKSLDDDLREGMSFTYAINANVEFVLLCFVIDGLLLRCRNNQISAKEEPQLIYTKLLTKKQRAQNCFALANGSVKSSLSKFR